MVYLSFNCKNPQSQKVTEIIEKYWHLIGGEFVNKPSNIAKEYEITLSQLKALIKKYSEAVVTYAQCMDCGRSIEAVVHSQRRFKRYQSPEIARGRRCRECRYAYNRKIRDFNFFKVNTPQEVIDLEMAVDKKVWCELSGKELDILKGIVKYKEKFLIYREVFMDHPNDTAICDIVKRLEQKGLIYVQRRLQWNVVGFEFSCRLEKELFGTAADSQSGHVFHSEPKSKADRDSFRFSLKPNLRKENPFQDDYAGTLQFSEAVSLKAGVKYVYRGYKNTDGSIACIFQPLHPILAVAEGCIEEMPRIIQTMLSENDEFNVEE